MPVRHQYSDLELLRMLQDGVEMAFDIIYDRYAGLLYSKLRKLVKLEIIIEEIHQDIFVRFWNSRSNLTADTNIQAYLFTITRNLVIDFYRKAAREKALQKQLLHHIESHYHHIEPILAYKETAQILEQLIRLLPPQRQTIFRMVKVEGKSYPEVAALCGISINTVKDHMKKSSHFIKSQMSKEFPHLLLSIIAYTILK